MQIKKCSAEMRKLKSIDEAMKQSVTAMVQLKDAFMQRKYEQFTNKQTISTGPNFLQRMQSDEERRKLELILSQFTQIGIPLEKLSLEMIS